MTKEKLRVLTVNVSDSSGGAARAAYRIHKATIEAGVDGLFLVKNRSLNDPNVLTVQSFDSLGSLKAPFRWVQYKINNKLQQARWRPYPDRQDVFMSDLRGSSLHGALQKIEYDILHLHWINLRFIDIEDLAKITKPIVWTLHDCWPFTGVCHYFYDCTRYKQSCGCCPHLASNSERDLSHKVWQKKMEIFSKLNIHVVCPSNWLAQAARESTIFKQFPVSVIPNPIDISYFTPGSRQMACELLQLNPDKKYILFGAMNAVRDKNKGYNEFLSAIRHFEEMADHSDVEIIIFGTNEELGALNIRLKVHNPGMLHDKQLLAVYRAASVMVVPSLSENLSNIIMESLSCGTPVVAFNIGGNSDMIDHKQNAYLAEPYNPQDLAAGIAWCLENNTSGELSHRARNNVEENYSMERVGEMYVELYKELIK